MNDVFISYGRADSKDFAAKLCDKLMAQGYRVWFDQKDIPAGVDFQNQIDDGIDNAHNFLFIIAPHSVRSSYCGKEIELAVRRKKRIIPVMHIETDKQTSEMMHPVIAKLNWIYFREKLDDFDGSFGKLSDLIDRHYDYTALHTRLLLKALDWEKNESRKSYLLPGKQRAEAEKWLETRFKTEQAPCEPSDLHARFICASEKHAHNGFTEVFISCPSDEAEIRDRVVSALNRRGITTWTELTDIEKGDLTREAVQKGIEQADNFFFFISEKSVANEGRLFELEVAKKLNKRIIPLLTEKVSRQNTPSQVADLQAINFTDSRDKAGFKKGIANLLNQINTDVSYYSFHKNVLARAGQWERQRQNPGLLLIGPELQNAREWLVTAKSRQLHRPTEIHERFIAESTKNAAQLSPDIFISRHPENSDFVRILAAELRSHGKSVYLKAEGSESEISDDTSGIDTSDNFLFVSSAAADGNPACEAEIDQAKNLNKRMIPLILAPSSSPVLEELAENKINFERGKADFHEAFSELIRTLDVDREYVHRHTAWLRAAMEWESGGKNSELLLRGNKLALARLWLAEADEENKQPRPSDLQREFIEQSEKAAFLAQEAEARRQRLKVRRTRQIAAVLGFLALLAVYQAFRAGQNAEEANVQRSEAEQQKHLADSARLQADSARVLAVNLKDQAIRAREEAVYARDRARKSEADAVIARDRSKISEEKAIVAQNKADAERRTAVKEKTRADIERGKARAEEAKATIAQADAVMSEKKARDLLMISEAKILAVKSVQQLNMQNRKTGAQLALHGFFLNRDYRGPRLVPEIYDALLASKSTLETTTHDIVRLHKFGVRSVTYSPKTKTFASGDEDGRLFLWFTDGRSPLRNKFEINTGSRIRSLCFTPLGEFLAVGKTDGRVEIRSLADIKNQSRKKLVLSRLGGPVRKMLFKDVPGERLFIAASSDSVMVKHMNKGFDFIRMEDEKLGVSSGFRSKNKRINDLSIRQTKTGLLMALATDKGLEIRKLVKNKWTLLRTLSDGKNLTAVQFHPNGNHLFYGDRQGIIYDTDSDGKTTPGSLAGHRSAVSSLVFSPDGSVLATSALDKTGRIWHFRNQKVLNDALILRGHTAWVWGLIFSADGNRVITASEDGNIRFWPAEPERLASELCEIINQRNIKYFSLDSVKLFLGDEAEIRYLQENCTGTFVPISPKKRRAAD